MEAGLKMILGRWSGSQALYAMLGILDFYLKVQQEATEGFKLGL